MKMKATFSAGCFWGVEEAFRKMRGVLSTRVGYTGGYFENPSYEDVCSGNTGHVEAVEVEYDPAVVSYAELLDLFWKIHDPTSLNRQGPDIGEQYRSVIFFHDLKQKAEARASKDMLESRGVYKRPIVTEILPVSRFYEAEEYHQRYLEKRAMSHCNL